jgi:hypothetical protein
MSIPTKKECEDDINCPICYDNITNEFFITHCGHIFHNKCFKEWSEQKYSCPICRAKTYHEPVWKKPFDPWGKRSAMEMDEMFGSFISTHTSNFLNICNIVDGRFSFPCL